MQKYFLLLALVLTTGLVGMHEIGAAPPAGVGNSDDATEITGTLHLGVLRGTGGESTIKATLETSDGSMYQLNATEEQLASVEPETEVAVTGTIKDGVILVDSIASASGTTAQGGDNDTNTLSIQSASVESTGLAPAETVNVLIIPANWNDKTLLDDSEDCTVAGVQSTAETAAGWIYEASNGLQDLTFETADIVTIENYSWTYDYNGTNWWHDPMYIWADTLDSGAESQGYTLDDYDAWLYVFPTLTHGSTGWTPMNKGQTDGRMWNFRCDSEHNTNSANGARNGFGSSNDSSDNWGIDYSTAMHGVVLQSNWNRSFDYGGNHKMMKDWIPSTSLEEIPSGTSTYTLDPVDVAPGSNIQTLALPAYHSADSITDNKHFISYRVPEGISADMPSKYANKVLIKEGRTSTYANTEVSGILSQPGDMWYSGDDNGYSVVLAAYNPDTSADVSVVDCELIEPVIDPQTTEESVFMAPNASYELTVSVFNNNDRHCKEKEFFLAALNTPIPPKGAFDIAPVDIVEIKPNQQRTVGLRVSTTDVEPGTYTFNYAAVHADSRMQSSPRSFTVYVEEGAGPHPPENLQVEPNTKGKCGKTSCADLNWSPPPFGTPDHYNVYHNGELIDSTTDQEYTHQPGEGTHAYSVSTVDADGLESQQTPEATVDLP